VKIIFLDLFHFNGQLAYMIIQTIPSLTRVAHRPAMAGKIAVDSVPTPPAKGTTLDAFEMTC
jgi:hypothetical protein